jgi:hypothetical protein
MRLRQRPGRATLRALRVHRARFGDALGVLCGKRAIAVNIEIMRAFVELRRAAAPYAALEERVRELERKTTARFGRHDEQLDQIFKALRQLTAPASQPKRAVGFRPPDDDDQ